MRQAAAARVGEPQNLAIPLGDPIVMIGIGQAGACGRLAEGLIQKPRQILRWIGNAEPGHEGFDEGGPTEHSQCGRIVGRGGADGESGHDGGIAFPARDASPAASLDCDS